MVVDRVNEFVMVDEPPAGYDSTLGDEDVQLCGDNLRADFVCTVFLQSSRLYGYS
jgi:hypothetical protein